MFRRGLATMVALALAASSAGGLSQPAPTVQVNASRKAKRGLFGGLQLAPMRSWRYRGPGITMAQQQRASAKAKNVRRNRAAHRG